MKNVTTQISGRILIFSTFCFRETLLGQLTVHIKSIQEDFSSKSGGYSGRSSEVPKGKNLPDVVNSIVWVNQLQTKVCIEHGVKFVQTENYPTCWRELLKR